MNHWWLNRTWIRERAWSDFIRTPTLLHYSRESILVWFWDENNLSFQGLNPLLLDVVREIAGHLSGLGQHSWSHTECFFCIWWPIPVQWSHDDCVWFSWDGFIFTSVPFKTEFTLREWQLHICMACNSPTPKPSVDIMLVCSTATKKVQKLLSLPLSTVFFLVGTCQLPRSF